jgi:amidase
MDTDLADLDATAQADLVRAGECTPLELVEAAIDRIERINPDINSVITARFDKVRAEARADQHPEGLLRGVPFLVKDAVCRTAGDPYHLGMRALRDRGYVARADTNLATNFRRAGLMILGRTNAPELAMGPTTEPLAYGPTRNPWDIARTPGGSSGGSAAAVAARLVPAAHGNDMGGSIRIPASFCGLVTVKASRARASLGPELGELWGPVTNEGALTRTVRDAAALLDVVAIPWPGDPYVAPPPQRPYTEEVAVQPGRLRIGLCPGVPDTPVHPECLAAIEKAGHLLEDLGHRVDPSYPPALVEPVVDEVSAVVWGTGVRRDVERLGEILGEPIDPKELEPFNRAMIEQAASVTATQYLAALEKMYAWARRVVSWWADGFDVLVTPTTTQPPPPLGVMAPDADLDQLSSQIGALTRLVAPFNATGQPAMSLPLHWSHDGLPIGVQLVAAYGREDLLLRLGAQLESAQPWQERLPEIHA